MEILFCIMLFCMGATFGSFFTLAVYRIPLGLDITHERSFCPNCNHRLEFIDLIPIFSYLSLGGKCRYCKNPIRIRYLLLEVLSGLVFLSAYFALKVSFPYFEIHSAALMIAFVMFYVTNAIILGIDKEYISIDKRVLLFGIITNAIYMVYLYIFESVNIYRYISYLILIIILVCVDTTLLKKGKKNYFLEILELLIYELSFMNNWYIVLATIIGTILIYHIYTIFKKKQIPLGFCLSLASIICFLAGQAIL